MIVTPTARLADRAFAFLADSLTCLRFFSRLPVPPLPFEPESWTSDALGRALRLAPLAGFVIGAGGAVMLWAGFAVFGLPSGIAAVLALGIQILLSGGLHEDGLADVADGFGGGTRRERKLEIMRDSRVGTFGVLALILSSALRVGTVAAILDRHGLFAAGMALMAAAAASRGFSLIPLGLLAPARADGLAHAAGHLPSSTLSTAMALAVFLATILGVVGGASEVGALMACGTAVLASLTMTGIAYRQIGGQTGDVAGAAQQLAEIACLMTLLVGPWLG